MSFAAAGFLDVCFGLAGCSVAHFNTASKTGRSVRAVAVISNSTRWWNLSIGGSLPNPSGFPAYVARKLMDLGYTQVPPARRADAWIAAGYEVQSGSAARLLFVRKHRGRASRNKVKRAQFDARHPVRHSA